VLYEAVLTVEDVAALPPSGRGFLFITVAFYTMLK
jgi:hypothetical protein